MKNVTQRFVLIAALLTAFTLMASKSPAPELESKTYNLTNFSSISLAIPADVFLTQGEGYACVVEGENSIFDKIEVKVEKGGLIIKCKARNFKFPKTKERTKIYIKLPTLTEINIAGSGNVNCVTPIDANHLELNVAGSGDIIIPILTVNRVEANVAGSGEIMISGSGRANSAEVNIAGSGDVWLKGIAFNDVEVNVAGSGDTYIEHAERLEVSIVGSGDVHYWGSSQVEKSIIGSGKVIRED